MAVSYEKSMRERAINDHKGLFTIDDIDYDENSRGGCETCDYGSRYGANVTVKGVKVTVADNGKPVPVSR
jgi:hypothetical protein